MIDPTKITNYNRSVPELEELLLFCILVAGKNATTTSKKLEELLSYGLAFTNGSPFKRIRVMAEEECLADVLKDFGIGCYHLKSKGLRAAANSGLDLRTCSVEQLEKIPGIGMKTSRFFVLHSRENARVSCLDTHVLKWLAYYSRFEIPKQTPSKKKYLELEQVFLKVADVLNIDPAILDLSIWNKSRGSDEESLVRTSQI